MKMLFRVALFVLAYASGVAMMMVQNPRLMIALALEFFLCSVSLLVWLVIDMRREREFKIPYVDDEEEDFLPTSGAGGGGARIIATGSGGSGGQ